MQRKPLVIVYRTVLIAGVAALPITAAYADDADGAFLRGLVVSYTIPENGDLNPYGVTFVPQGFPGGGSIAPGDVLISNFNNLNNLQGTGTATIKLTPNGTVAPAGTATTFFKSTLAGLDTALGVLQGGFVLVGNVPPTDGTINTKSLGSLPGSNRPGQLVQVLNDGAFLDSPWDLAINDNGSQAQVFVSNVLGGTVSRLDLAVGPSNITVLHKT